MAFLSLVSCVIARPILMTDPTWPDLIRPEPPTASTRRLLVVDFDFFFPNPLDAGAADTRSLRLYDWGHAETVIHREVIWPVRAAAFTAEGLRLPRCQPTTGFWDRFTFDTDHLLVADSNAYAGPLAWEGGYGQVVVFDAHHDCGYRRSYPDYLATGEFTCEDWTYPHHEAGAAITVRYPTWRRRWPRMEPSTGIPVARHTDDGGRLAGVFTTVFACRSGGWVPAWCDDQWQQFIDAFPGRLVSVDPDLRPRWPSAGG
jgi:hypothetical protein